MKTLTLRLVSIRGCCTMWIRCIGRSTRHGRRQREHSRDSKKSVASIGYARSRGSRWRMGRECLSFGLSLSLSLFVLLRMHFIKCWNRNCLKRIWCKKIRARHGGCREGAREVKRNTRFASSHHASAHAKSAHELQRSAPNRLQRCRIHGDRDENNCHFHDFTGTC